MNGGMMKSPMKLVTEKCKLMHVRKNNYTYIKSRLQINCCHQEKKKKSDHSISAEGRKTIVTLTFIRKQMEEGDGNHLHITGCIHDVALL